MSALTTLTKLSLAVPEEIIDEYRKLGLHSISLRPLSPYGFATKTASRTGYTTSDYLTFYKRAFEHLVAVNHSGYAIDESYAALLLSQLFTSFGHGYVDLRSPSGAGLGRSSTTTMVAYIPRTRHGCWLQWATRHGASAT